jgi:hypothetical protein
MSVRRARFPWGYSAILFNSSACSRMAGHFAAPARYARYYSALRRPVPWCF